MLKQIINNPIMVLMLMLGAVIFGLKSFINMPVNLLPNVDFPTITITTTYQGADAKSIENKISSKIEEAVSSIDGIDELTSVSSDGVSSVTVQFKLEKDLERAFNEVRSEVGKVILPLEAQRPKIAKLAAGDIVLGVFMNAKNVDEKTLMKDAEEIIKPALQNVLGVGGVTINGLRKREIRVFLNSFLLNKYSLSASEVSRVLNSNNINQGGGKIINSLNEFVIKTSSKVESIEDVKNIQIKKGVLLKDVATVVDSISDTNAYAAKGTQVGVYITIKRILGASSLDIIKGEKEKLKELSKKYANQYEFTILQDMSLNIKANLSNLIFDLIFGSFLAILIVYVFLRNVYATIITAIAIPISTIGAFGILDFVGYDLNRLTMLGLILSIGIFIDDSIVVVENITKKLEGGMDVVQASHEGIKEIAFSVLSITAVLLAVFIPIAFLDGVVGKYFVSFAVSVVSGIIISYIVAVVCIPTVSARILKSTQGGFYKKTEPFFTMCEEKYKDFLHLTLKHKYKTIAFTILTIIVAFIPKVGLEFVPSEDRSEFSITFESKIGTSLSHTIELSEQIKKYLDKHQDVKDHIVYLDNGNKGGFFVILKDIKDRPSSKSQNEIINDLRESFSNIKGLDVKIGGSRGATPLSLSLLGDSFKVLDNVSKALIAKMSKIDGAVDVDRNYENTQPQIEIIINKAKAANAGVEATLIAKEISSSFVGSIPISKYVDGGKEYDITMRYADDARVSIDDIKKIQVKNNKGDLIFIDSLIEVKKVYGSPTINRYNRQRQIKVTSNLNGKIPLGDLQAKTEEIVKTLLPQGYIYSFSGDAKFMAETGAAFAAAIGLACILIYLILSSLYGSIIQPFLIMVSMPLCIAGVVGALYIGGSSFNLFVMIGIVLLMGMVGKNAILVVDCANENIKSNQSLDDAVINAGKQRLRPILMTTFAMIGAMLPTVFSSGIGSETNSSMALAIIGGLIASTALTLIVIPSLYKIMYPLDKWLRSFYEIKGL